MSTKTEAVKDKAIDPAAAAQARADELAKNRDKDAKVMAKADVRDRLLLELADRIIAHPEGLSDRVSALRGELAEEMGLVGTVADGQIVQHPDVRAAERQANIDKAVAGAIAEGLVPEDHKPAEDVKAAAQDQHPTSATAVTVAVPAGTPASEVKQDKPMDPTAKK